MNPIPTIQQVSVLLEQELGTKPSKLVRMTFGHSDSAVYEVYLSKTQLFIKLNPRREVIENLVSNMCVLGKLGVPVPEVFRVHLSNDSHSYVLLEKIPGRDLRYELENMAQAQMSILAKQLVDYQRKVMTLPKGQGFGWVAIGQQGNFASWTELIAQEVNKIKGFSTDHLVRRIMAIAEQLNPYFVKVEPICHLDDITIKNVIVHNGELQGLY